ncbi:MAG: amidohydrolase family protein [Candidatus Doudnabacteria bacterium]|nr:amidohydrolase family protein [Candidatus Doudnabacteria bacterium]
MYSLLIKNAKVVDGTGKPGEILDVAVEGDKIANIDKNIPSHAQSLVDASGKVLAPGFIDLQNHSDSYWQIFDNPSLDSLITQGYTSIILGNCGASLAPLLSSESLLAMQKWHELAAANINWQTFEEFLNQLSQRKFTCNLGSLAGYGTLRRGVVGDQVRSLDKPEFKAITRILEETLDAGAFGLSNGLSYAHEIIVSELELFELAKILKRREALFSVHLRSEGSHILEAVDEALDIARNTEVNLKISHFKIRGKQNFPKFSHALGDLETAYHKGINAHFDVYPYDTIWQVLYSYLPKWAVEGGRPMIIRHLQDPVQRNKILLYLNSLQVQFPELVIASTANKLSFTGKTLGQIAKNLEISSEQAVLELIQNGGNEILVFEKNLMEEQVRELLFHPLSIIGTDGAGFHASLKDKLVHPRCFGSAPRFLRLSRDAKFALESSIKKLTSAPAKKIGLKARGEIKVGNFADLVVFDPDKITDKATYLNPYQYSEGIEYVFVNGRAVISESKVTGQVPGRVLRKA